MCLNNKQIKMIYYIYVYMLHPSNPKQVNLLESYTFAL